MKTYVEMIRENKDLPPLPEVIFYISQKLNDPDSNIEDIAGYIQTDPVLTGRIVVWANSVYIAGERLQVHNVKMAVIRLGLKEIRNIIFTMTLLKLFKDNKILNQSKYWLHSLSVAICSRELSKTSIFESIDEDLAYMAGLMHDIGMMVFGYIAPKAYGTFLAKRKEFVEKAGNEKKKIRQLHESEQKVFGIDHPTIGAAYLEEWWPVDDAIIKAVGEHHKDDTGDISELGKIVQLANLFCNKSGILNGVKRERDVNAKSLSLLDDFDDETIEKFNQVAKSSITEAKLILTF